MTKRDIKLEFHLEGCNEPYCETCIAAKPDPRSWPGEEGYCGGCRMLVAVEDGLLIEHRGSFAKHFGNAACRGSGEAPLPLPDNTVDEWEEKPDERPRGTSDPAGQSYGP